MSVHPVEVSAVKTFEMLPTARSFSSAVFNKEPRYEIGSGQKVTFPTIFSKFIQIDNRFSVSCVLHEE